MTITNNTLTQIEVNTSEEPDKRIIWLHGLGADGNDFAPFVPELSLPSRLRVRFIFPNAPSIPVSINQGYVMPAWYDIHAADLNDRSDIAGIQRSVGQINAILEREMANGIAAENIILGGFSQGAVIALTTGLMFTKRLGGILALSGMLPNSQSVLQAAAPENKDTPIFIGHGSEDWVVPAAQGRQAFDTLTHAQYKVAWHLYPMPHSVSREEINDISLWIQTIWA